MTDKTSPVVHDNQSHSALLAHTSTQIPYEIMGISTTSTSEMDSVANETSTIPQELKTATNSEDPQRTTPTRTSPNGSPAPSLEPSERGVLRPSFKRPREEDDHEEKDAPPLPTKPATEAKTQMEGTGEISPTKPRPLDKAIAYDNGQYVDEQVELRELKRQSKTSPTSMPKNVIAKASRSRACAACKRRKVKCNHSTAGREADTKGTASKQLSLQGGIDELETASKFVEAKADDELGLTKVTSLNEDAEITHPAPLEEEPPKTTKGRKKAAPKKARPPPERTSTRNRKAPERFEDLQEQPPSKALPTKKGSSKVFDPVYITTNSTSRLGKADMYHMLTDDDTAWTSLSTEQQATLVTMLPDTAETQRLLAKIQAGETENTRPQYLKASDVFRTEVAKFQADLTNGHLAKTWQSAAEQAVAERAAGDYDAWKAAEAELWWGQKSK